MSNAILPSAALDRRASPVMPLFTRGGELGSAWPRPRCPGGGGGSPSALLINPLRTHLSPPRYSISGDIDGDKMAASVHDEQRRVTRPGAALLTGAMIIGFYLSAMTPAPADANARVMASDQIPGQSPAVSAVAKDFDSGPLFLRDLLITPGFQ